MDQNELKERTKVLRPARRIRRRLAAFRKLKLKGEIIVARKRARLQNPI
jgi:hypothetical protein